MSVKIRLARRGRKKLALFDVVVADARSPRDGRFIEKIGTYNPNTDPATIDINGDRALYWLQSGAQPTDTVRRMLSYRGVMLRKHLQHGVAKGAISQDQADAKLTDWMGGKAGLIDNKRAELAEKKANDFKTRLAAEAAKKEAKAQSIADKKAALLASATEAMDDMKEVSDLPSEEAETSAE
jgi:small subunit ribosomal protein S16